MLEVHSHQIQSMENVEIHSGVDSTLNLIERVRAECRDHPAALAIESGSCHVTYAELGNQADIIAAMVRSAHAARPVK